MMESIEQYLQDWSDACEYANECAPDLSFLGNGEPFTALASIAAICFAVWAINELRINRGMRARPIAAPRDAGELKTVVEKMKQEPASREKLAA
jgi:hypothetical protein